MRFDFCKSNLHPACEEHKYDHCEMCNMARAYQHGYETAQEDMSKDAVEVVRCKECRYFKKIVERSDSGLCYRDLVASAWKENGYCSRGERKGGDTE